ncbi:MAG: hypothetical protein AB4042_07300 [Leptolyngbyaceae cyanobacterium]
MPTPLPPQSTPLVSPQVQSESPESSSSGPKPSVTVRWRSLLAKTTVWLAAEIILGIMGLDHLADYSEFMIQRQMLAQVTETIAHIISSV